MILHKGTQQLETERLILRRYRMDDAADMYENWVADSEVTRFWGWKPHENIEETKTLLQGWICDYEKTDHYHWVIEDKAQAKAIGYIYLNEMDDAEACAAVHYLLSRKHWNRGIMTEACTSVLDFAFAELGLQKVVSRHHELNPASGRVLKKCGFRFLYKECKMFADCPQLDGVYLLYEKGLLDKK